MSSGDAGVTVYRYVGEDGTIHFTDDPSQIPAEYREGAEARPQLAIEPPNEVELAKEEATQFHLPSFILGVGAALIIAAVFKLFSGSYRVIFKIAGVVALVALATSLYFGYLRSVAGVGDGRPASPQEIVEDAKKAAEDVKKRIEEQKRELDQTER